VTEPSTEVTAVVDTRLAHGMHRRASTLLAEAAVRPTVPLAVLTELREFLVANLRHHHETEDELLWPRIAAVAPETAAALAEISAEHVRLDAALVALAAADGPAIHDPAAVVRDLVHLHLEHEEPLLFPVLRDQLPPESWTAFAQQVIATSPPVAPHLLIAFFDQVGTPDEVALVLSGLPEQAREMVPMLREQGRLALAVLSGEDDAG
jgi:hypothetical protein